MRDTCIAISTYNRPWYLWASLSSLLDQPEVKEHDLFVFCDGGEMAWERAVSDVLESLQHEYGLGFKLVVRDEHLGLGRALIRMRREIFDKYGYKGAHFIEDDAVPGPRYFQVMPRLWKWAQQYSGIGAVGLWCDRPQSMQANMYLQRKVHVSNVNWFAYYLDAEAWDVIRYMHNEYEQRFLMDRAYHARDCEAIRNYFIDCWKNRTVRSRPGLPIPPDAYVWDISDWFQHHEAMATGQDALLSASLACAGLVRLSTAASRMSYIGESGHTTDSQWFKQSVFSGLTTQIFAEGDELREDFEFETELDRNKAGKLCRQPQA